MPQTSSRRTVHIIGDGASAVAVYLGLIRDLNIPNVTIMWHLPNSDHLSFGVAYGSSADQQLHFLNSEAQSMSIPGYTSFVDWLGWRHGDCASKDTFLPRAFYREYLQHLVEITPLPMTWERRFNHFRFSAVDVAPRREFMYCAYVWCVGAVPKEMNALVDVENPWTYDWKTLKVKPRKNILIYGTGLTAIDAALSAATNSEADTSITLASRSGRSPLPFVPTPDPSSQLQDWAHSSYLEPVETVRDLIKKARSLPSGQWNTFMKAMRPHWTKLWQKWSEKEKQRAFRIMPFFDIHRHKITPPILELLSKFPSIRFAKLQDINPINYDFVINATGIDYNPERNASLKYTSHLLGIDMAAGPWGFANASTDCRIGPNSWCVGAYMKQKLGEATAMPEIVGMSKLVIAGIARHFTQPD